MLLVLFPVALILGSVEMGVDAVSVRLVILPVPIVDVPIGMDQPALSIGLVLHPVAFVEGTVGPDLHTFPLPHLATFEPLTRVFGSVFQGALGTRTPLTQHLFELPVVIVEFTQFFAHLLHLHVVVVFASVRTHAPHSTWRVQLRPQSLSLLAGQPSTERRLNSNDDDKILDCVGFAVKGGRLDCAGQFGVSVTAIFFAAAVLSHLI